MHNKFGEVLQAEGNGVLGFGVFGEFLADKNIEPGSTKFALLAFVVGLM